MENVMQKILWIAVAISACALSACVSSGANAVPPPDAVKDWKGATSLEGGAGLASAELVPEMEHWYSSSIQSAPKFYAVNVAKNTTCEIYWDDKKEGTGKYSGDVVFWVFKMDGKTKYGTSDKGFLKPISFKPTETTINIVVTAMSGGTFAFGVRQVK
jgi:hypothetical protein